MSLERFRSFDSFREFGGAVVPVQHYGFDQSSLPTVDGQLLVSSAYAMPEAGTALWQLDVLTSTALPTHFGTMLGSNSGFNLRYESTTSVRAFVRNAAGAAVNIEHTHGATIIGAPVLAYATWDGATSDLDAGVDAAETDGATVGIDNAVPDVDHHIGGKDGLTNGLTYTGMQYAAFDAQLADPDAASGEPFATFYLANPNLTACPAPEPGLALGTPIGTPVYRDTDQAIPESRLTVALPNDFVVTGGPWDDAGGTGGRLDGLANITATDLVNGQPFATDVRLFTIAARVTTPSVLNATKGIIVRSDNSAPDAHGIGILNVATGLMRFTAIEEDNSNHNFTLTVALSASTAYMVIGIWDLDANTMEGYVYDVAGTLIDSGTLTEAGIDAVHADSLHHVGATAALGAWDNGGIIHELMTFEGIALDSAARIALADSSDLTGGGTRTRRYEGLTAGVVDVADNSRLWYAVGGATPTTVGSVQW